MLYAMPIIIHGLPCVELCEGDEPFPTEAAYPIPEGSCCEYLVIEAGVCRVKTTEEIQAWNDKLAEITAAEEVARQFAKSDALKDAENKFLSLCDQLTGSTSHTKLGFARLNQYIAAMPDQGQALYLGATLLSVDAECKREGGNRWWDDCIWHPERIVL